MSSDDQRLNAYLASQNYFANVAEEVATRMIVDWLQNNLPHILKRIRDAAGDVWRTIRDWFDF